MSQILAWLEALWSMDMVRAGLRAAAIMACGLLVTRMVNRQMSSWGMHVQHRMLLRRVATGAVLVLALALALAELGLQLGVLLGTAGIVTVAVGFAAQTSVSNLISGLFLMGEQPFRVGETITVGGTTGEVLSIDLLSVKLCTSDNLLVRIPNETVLKGNVINLTRLAIRRCDIKISVSYHEDLGRVRSVLLDVAEHEPACLKNPKPSFSFVEFGDARIAVQLSVWSRRENHGAVRNALAEGIKRAFETHGIELPGGPRPAAAAPASNPAAAPSTTAQQQA